MTVTAWPVSRVHQLGCLYIVLTIKCQVYLHFLNSSYIMKHCSVWQWSAKDSEQGTSPHPTETRGSTPVDCNCGQGTWLCGGCVQGTPLWMVLWRAATLDSQQDKMGRSRLQLWHFCYKISRNGIAILLWSHWTNADAQWKLTFRCEKLHLVCFWYSIATEKYIKGQDSIWKT